MTQFPPEVAVLYAEGYALTRFLVERKDHKTFLRFVDQGMKDGWDAAVKAHYGLKDVNALEKAWLADLRLKAVEAKEESKSRLPRGPAPEVLLASVESAGKIRLRLNRVVSAIYYEPVTTPKGSGPDQGQPVTTYMMRKKDSVQQSYHDLNDVKAFLSDGKPIEVNKLRHLLQKETAVLVSRDGKPVDPFYLQVIKEGTVILVVPPVLAPPPAQAPPEPAVEELPPTAPRGR